MGEIVFVPYGGLHALCLAACLFLIAAPSWLGRTFAGEPGGAERQLRLALAALAVIYWIAYNIWWNRNGLDLRTGLPLQVCDLNGLIAPLALVTGWRWARATLYFFTAALTVQAFIQPMLSDGPGSLIFWAFWIGHTLIAASAVYDIVVLGFRPTWRDLGYAAIAGVAYIVAVLPIDLWLGANYGFIGNPVDRSEIPPFIDAMGTWPLRAVIVVALAPLGFIIVLLPWLIFGSRQESRQPPQHATRPLQQDLP